MDKYVALRSALYKDVVLISITGPIMGPQNRETDWGRAEGPLQMDHVSFLGAHTHVSLCHIVVPMPRKHVPRKIEIQLLLV